MNMAIGVTGGRVRGHRVGAGLLAWRGIPYAAPPVGALRLRAPEPVRPWSGVREAIAFGNPAPQRKRRDTSEDCLTLNVLTPSGPTRKPRPVVVFFHGGAYLTGTSAGPLYRGEQLVGRGDVVYVSVNYRLGALGYLDFREQGFDANLGLRDQIAALEWVRDNISAFGGDPDNVTIMGQSAGGNAVTTLLCVPAARGLFARGIAESPPVASANDSGTAQAWARRFVTELGTDLGSAPAESLVQTAHTMAMRAADEFPGSRPFAPVVDGELLPETPLDAFANGTANPVPLLLGTNAQEGRLFPLVLDIAPSNPARIRKLLAGTDPEVSARIRAAYRSRGSVAFGGDVLFLDPALRCAEGHSVTAPTYFYRYDFAPRLLELARIGATHGTELLAVFGIGDTALGRATTALGGRRALRAVTETVQRHWFSFARGGAPEADWPRYTPTERSTYVIDERSRVVADPDAAQREAFVGYR